MSNPVVTGWHPKATADPITVSSGRRAWRIVTWLSTRLSGFQPRMVVPSARSRRLTARGAPPAPPEGAGGLEPFAREPAHRDDLVLEHVGEGPHACVALGVGLAHDLAAPLAGPRSQVRVVPVEHHAGRIAARRLRDAVDEPRDLRLADADDVDAAED